MIKTAILFGYGINCQDETEYACRSAGSGVVKKIHVNKFLNGTERIEDYHFLIFPGGFSGGDQLGAGVFFSLKMEKLRDDIENFIHEGRLILGICNGFQILTKLGLLPGISNYKTKSVELTYNDCGNFQDRWVYLKMNKNSPCIFTRGIERIELPIRHGEGKFWAAEETLEEMKRNEQIVVQYAKPDGTLANRNFPFNPNGSLLDIAGICDRTGRVFGIMPHPEGYTQWFNHPKWTILKEELKRKNEKYPEEGDGMQIFRNAYKYLDEF